MPDSAEPDSAAPALQSTPKRRRMVLLFSIAVVVLAIDLTAKIWAVAELSGREPVRLFGGALYLTLARNSGAAFSMGTDFTVVITCIMIIVIAGILFMSRKVRSLPWACALGMILGGACGNLVDRLFRHPAPFKGAVVDFFSVFDPYGRAFAIFNTADVFIVSGGILAGLLAILGRELDGRTTKEVEASKAAEAPGAQS